MNRLYEIKVRRYVLHFKVRIHNLKYLLSNENMKLYEIFLLYFPLSKILHNLVFICVFYVILLFIVSVETNVKITIVLPHYFSK